MLRSYVVPAVNMLPTTVIVKENGKHKNNNNETD